MLKDATGHGGMKFFPLVFSLFMFVLVANLFGMIPCFFTVGSARSSSPSPGRSSSSAPCVVYGIRQARLRISSSLFVPSGVPVVLLPLVALIEVISFLSRPISLSVRLFANMLAGHITLKVFAGFVFSLRHARPARHCRRDPAARHDRWR